MKPSEFNDDPAASTAGSITASEARKAAAVCKDVSVDFGRGETRVRALRNVSCTVAGRSRLAVIGRSGSGKSTLLHVMAGLQPPTSGAIEWPFLESNPLERPGSVGCVFQGPSLLAPLDACENVALPLLLAGVSELDATARALDALRRLDLHELAHVLPENMSGGQAQRVAVARVLASEPTLVLADEPTGQLDHETAAHLLDVLVDAVDQLGAALVVSTHDPRVADRLVEVWQIEDGRLRTSEDGDA
jgi:ABC-type lipoprotein export system ATPase subunit